jgi:prepilin-type N-terminal cleavage/methylation domain-containing protein
MQIKARQKQRGFTLLEVIVALTITGFVLGGLFALAGGSKQLAWKSVQSLENAAAARARINFALLEDDYGFIEPILVTNAYQIRSAELVDPPLRKTQPSIFSLQTYEVINEETDEIIHGSRWTRLELPR